MEEILNEILYELKGIRQALDKGHGLHQLKEILDKGSCIPLMITIGEDVIVEKVISNINRQNRISGKTTVIV